MNERRIAIALLEQYNSNPDQFSDRQAERIAQIARKHGLRFDRENKFASKLAFDLADTALLGMIPNRLRPVSRGESVFGETERDRVAGGLGWLGAIPTLGAGIAGRGAIMAGGKALGKAGIGAGASAYGMAGRGIAQATPYAQKATKYASDLIKNAPETFSRAGVKANNIRMYARQKAGNLTSLERGNTTNWFGQLRDNFMNPIREQNLLDQALRTGSSRIGTRLTMDTNTLAGLV